ncbi:MAG: TFIIB-type zinc ribbon-containing protein [Anaerorhabdus sp.]
MTEIKENEEKITEEVLDHSTDEKNTQKKCYSCGSTDISLNTETGNLRCNFCRSEQPKELFADKTVDSLDKKYISKGASDIKSDASDIVTLKCTSCGAEVVIDTTDSAQSRCHWCRNYLSINNQIENGAIPDALLPFNVLKDSAKKEIENFVGKRKFFALKKFKSEFTSDNILGVYFPYLLIDIKAKCQFHGKGERLVRKYQVKSGKHTSTRYDADLYDVKRDFDIFIDDLSIEASDDKLSYHANKTNNIINSIMPFDTENSVVWDANYLRGFSSEKRDINIDKIDNIVKSQSLDVARHSINNTLNFYDRGVCWNDEKVESIGEFWKAVYLPVWLYSYQQKKGHKNIIHYLAVNGRTKEVMGSVPIDQFKLFAVSFMLEVIGFFFWWTYLIDEDFGWLCMTIGFIYYGIIHVRYRNDNARHYHEIETLKEVSNVVKEDNFIKHEYRLNRSKISGANNHSINSRSLNQTMFGKAVDVLSSSDDNDIDTFLPE